MASKAPDMIEPTSGTIFSRPHVITVDTIAHLFRRLGDQR